MKKIVLLVLLAAGFQQLKAQQLVVPAQLNLQLSNGLTGNYFKPETFNLLAAKPDSANASREDQNSIVVYSKMPVEKITRSNIDHMPIYNPTASGEKYTMLIKKVVVNPAEPVVAVAP
jgi:hypothetical protein